MEAPRWERFVDWLAERGLLTSAMPSRAPVEGVSASLDDLRAGQGGRARAPRRRQHGGPVHECIPAQLVRDNRVCCRLPIWLDLARSGR